MSFQNNPAGRLYELLEEARKKNQGVTCQKVWCSVLGLDEASSVGVLLSLNKVFELIGIAKRQVAANGGTDPVLHDEPFEKVARAFIAVTLDQPWSRFLEHLDDKTMMCLRASADLLAKSSSVEVVIKAEDLETLRAEVDRLLGEVKMSDLDRVLKDAIVRSLGDVLRAILEYRITGTEGLERAVEQGYGCAFLHRARVAENKDNPLVRRWRDSMVHVAHVLDIGVKSKQLFGPAVQHLREIVFGG